MNMIPAEQIARYEPTFERIGGRPIGLSTAIRACYTGAQPARFGGKICGGADKAEESKSATSGKAEMKQRQKETGRKPQPRRRKRSQEKNWFTPVEIRDALKRMGFPFENYKANPLASIHTTLEAHGPGGDGNQDAERRAESLSVEKRGRVVAGVCRSPAMADGQFQRDGASGTVIALKRDPKDQKGNADSPQDAPPKGAKRGTSGGA